MSESEKNWPEKLSAATAEGDRDKALAELRTILVKGLGSGLAGKAGVDASFVEDVTQIALVKILDHPESFQGRSRFTTWALAIALRVAFSELRRKHWNNVSLDELKEKGNEPPRSIAPEPSPHKQSSRNDLVSLLHVFIETHLTARQKDVIIAELHGMPQGEIAKQLGSSRNAIYKVAHDARKALKRALEDAGYSMEDFRDISSETQTKGTTWH